MFLWIAFLPNFIQDKPNSTGQSSRIVIKSARVQTDFSEEPYQRVVSFTCDGGRVVTGGGDGVVRVWEVRCVCECEGESGDWGRWWGGESVGGEVCECEGESVCQWLVLIL